MATERLYINNEIRAQELRVIGADGGNLGVLALDAALAAAKVAGLDLIEISPSAIPPVAKIMDYGKFEYERSKKEKVAKSKVKISETKEVQIKGTNAIDDERYYFGSITKQEQLVNGFRALTGTAVITFNDLTTVYNAMAADTPVALSLSVQSANFISGSTYGAVNILIPRLYWDKDAINLKGPQLIDQDIAFTALYDNVNTPIQIQYVTLDSAP